MTTTNLIHLFQVIDQGISPRGFNISCLVEESVTNCQVNGTSVTDRSALFSYGSELKGRDVSFNVSYDYGMCVNSPVTATLRSNFKCITIFSS